jgi:hypothetical protein
VSEPAADVLPLVRERVVEIEDETADHHNGLVTNRSL